MNIGTMKKRLILSAFVVLLTTSCLWATSAKVSFPPLKDGDIIFQTSTSRQSGAIFAATRNSFTHMGIIKVLNDSFVVIEASNVVKETGLDEWVNWGLLNRVAVYRDDDLTIEQTKSIFSSASKLYGKPYDVFFSFGDEAIYCSELPFLAYKNAGISIGKIQKVSELNFDNALVKRIIKQRWERYPDCKSKSYDFAQCYNHILNQSLITPASIANDTKFKQVYSNYPF
jgi:Permuted papain-like amidase enzyme, YaeF/YiiX, C92 family